MSRAGAPIGPVCRIISSNATLYGVALTIERVALLRRVELFAGSADRVLAGIARVLEEVTCPAGAVIMEAGAVEDWLFVVEHGEVEVIRPDLRVRMGIGSVVGELAVLDARPRSAPVVFMAPSLAPFVAAALSDALLSPTPPRMPDVGTGRLRAWSMASARAASSAVGSKNPRSSAMTRGGAASRFSITCA